MLHFPCLPNGGWWLSASQFVSNDNLLCDSLNVNLLLFLLSLPNTNVVVVVSASYKYFQ